MNEKTETQKTDKQSKAEHKHVRELEINNALNDASLAVLFSLYQFCQSPLAIVMDKMKSFNTFNEFLNAAVESDVHSFFDIPKEAPKSENID